METEERRLVVMGRAEIDTRAPFGSVKEAVSLFGERVLAGEIYANKLKQMRGGASESGQSQSRMGALTAELEETKLSLKKSRAEAELMTNCVKSLKEELEQTKKELQWLKTKEMFKKQPVIIDDPGIEDLKFIENATKVDTNSHMDDIDNDGDDDEEEAAEFGKKRYVKFASPPSLAKVIVTKEELLGRPPSDKKAIKKKALAPILGWLFSKKKMVNLQE
ncbi:WEB family protein At2g17940 [Ricinus communis]|uniref:WEB family protein At2g17940 n=1 Tax=Ricinus communis TaxID=3988 RepID=UPI00201A7726|nr:WEB family protein At2g17940 [Ricinus communis]